MARSFAGGASTDVVTVTQAAAINNLAPISMSMWANITAFDATSRRLTQKGANPPVAGSDYHSWLCYIAGGPANRIQFNANLWGTTPGTWDWAAPTTGVWHHFLLTYAYALTTDNPTLYIDGISQTLIPLTTPVGALGSEAKDYLIGNVNGNRAFDGSITEPALFNAVLTQADATLLAGGISPCDSRLSAAAVHYMPWDAGQSPEPDLVAARNGTVTGTSDATDPSALTHPRCLPDARSIMSMRVPARA